MKLHVGTSGFSYKEWKGSFYPKDLPAGDMLGHYATRLPAVEINNTFYRLPRASVLESWAEQVPADFRFAIKASRRITHLKRLKDTLEETTYLLRTLEALGERLGFILFQLPPNLKLDLPRLDAFLTLLAGEKRAVMEFRHDSWLDEEVFERLRDRDCAVCVSDTDEKPDPDLIATASRGYLRLRRSDYTDEQLRSWLARIDRQPWKQAYVFFKHEQEASGPALAERMLKEGTEGPRD